MATATYPPPPPYYRLYKDYIENPKSAPEPPPPIEGTYVLYGANYTSCRPSSPFRPAPPSFLDRFNSKSSKCNTIYASTSAINP